MICDKCRNELVIANEFTFAREQDGQLKVFSAVDLKCDNEKCPDGRSGVPKKRLLREVLPSGCGKSAVCCCGVPLAYISENAYSVPDEGVVVSDDSLALALRCPVCGRLVECGVEGKEKQTTT